jgi:hypothetical protein
MRNCTVQATLELLAKFFTVCLLTTALLAAVAALPTPAHAQSVVLPKEGMQYFTAGLSLNPGILHDSGNSNRGSQSAVAAAGMGQLGVTQIITRTFYMSAEAQVGLQWFDEHTADQDADASSSTSFAWQLGLNMQWLPLGEELGLVTSGGLHLYQVQLDDAPLQVLGGELRVGKYIWTADEEFLLVQLGYTAPLIQGLDRPTEFDATNEWEDRSWSFHRFSIGFQYGF